MKNTYKTISITIITVFGIALIASIVFQFVPSCQNSDVSTFIKDWGMIIATVLLGIIVILQNESFRKENETRYMQSVLQNSTSLICFKKIVLHTQKYHYRDDSQTLKLKTDDNNGEMVCIDLTLNCEKAMLRCISINSVMFGFYQKEQTSYFFKSDSKKETNNLSLIDQNNYLLRFNLLFYNDHKCSEKLTKLCDERGILSLLINYRVKNIFNVTYNGQAHLKVTLKKYINQNDIINYTCRLDVLNNIITNQPNIETET